MSWASRRMRRRSERLAKWLAPGLEPVVLEERADGVGDLLVAVLADDQAVVRVGAERLVLGAQPLGQALAVAAPGTCDRGRRR